MPTIEMDKEVAEDLILYKIHNIRIYIEQIFNRWNETSAQTFLDKARNGILENAENDAIELTQLLIDEQKLKKLQNKLGI
jgi:hypothetical protein